MLGRNQWAGIGRHRPGREVFPTVSYVGTGISLHTVGTSLFLHRGTYGDTLLHKSHLGDTVLHRNQWVGTEWHRGVHMIYRSAKEATMSYKIGHFVA